MLALVKSLVQKLIGGLVGTRFLAAVRDQAVLPSLLVVRDLRAAEVLSKLVEVEWLLPVVRTRADGWEAGHPISQFVRVKRAFGWLTAWSRRRTLWYSSAPHRRSPQPLITPSHDPFFADRNHFCPWGRLTN
jgi:hypothetical protein